MPKRPDQLVEYSEHTVFDARYCGTYITHEEVFGRQSTVNELNKLLVKYGVDQIVCIIATVNNRVCHVPGLSIGENHTLQVRLVAEHMSPEPGKALESSRFGRDNRCVIFHAQQQMYLLRFVLSRCSRKEAALDLPKLLDDFTVACLTVNGLLNHMKQLTPGDMRSLIPCPRSSVLISLSGKLNRPLHRAKRCSVQNGLRTIRA
jgi:hypothetical protein